MAISINGNGTITGISVGGLPDGIVDNGTLANNSVNSNQIVSGAVGTAEIADIFTSGGITIGGLRIVTGSFTSPSSVSDVGDNTTYPGARYYFKATLSISGFQYIPAFSASIASGYHEGYFATLHESASTTQIKPYFSAHRSGAISSQPIYWAAIGEAS